MSTYFVVFGACVAAKSALDASGPSKDSYPAAGVTRPALRATR